ncbi:MAG: cytochrome c biogenesis CcdA family protein [Acidimicrobiia bacterium]
MIEAPFAIAFGAGLVATMNPCGFAMLPAYLSYFMGLGDEETTRAASLRRALVIGLIMSAAFLVVFGVFGLLITAGFRAVIDWIPWIALTVGAVIVVLGIAMVRGYELTVALPKAKSGSQSKGLRSVFGFGLSYGFASLSCTLPVFLSVVATQLTAASFVTGVTTFIVYGLGMSMMLMAVTIVLATGKQTLVNRLRASARYINRIAGVVLVIAGAYIVWFWTTSLSSGSSALADDGAFTFVETLSQRATEIFGENAALWALVFGGLIAAVAAYAFFSKEGGGGGGDEGGRPRPRGRGRVVAGASVAALLFGSFAGFLVARSDGANDSGSAAGVAAAPRGPLAPSNVFGLFDGSSATFADYRAAPSS